MLYLEDYLEMIEQLPQELRDRFTDVRELDLQVQNAYDSLEERTKSYFTNAKRMKMSERESEFQNIKREYLRALEDADEKVEIAGQLYALVDRYLRRLDTELHKFKMELEADNAGITELLEKRSLELDTTPINNIPKEVPRRGSNATVSSAEKRNQVERKVVTSGSANVESPGSYTLGQMGVGSNVIAVAASQAIAATQQMQQGRRTASMKASYEAVNTGGVHDFSIGRELAAHGSSEKKQKRRNATPSPGPLEELVGGDSLMDGGPLSSDADWTYDPNEPRYCICNQVSYGDMVACDNGGCPVEWFHYPCVGLTSAPRGKWYCPQCTANSRRRGGRKDKA